jgi:hypothetical protein
MTLNRKSKTTYAQWCFKHGIPWAPIPIPPDLLAAWLSGKQHTSHAQGPSVIAPMEQPNTLMDLFSVSCVPADTTGTGPNGNRQ